MSPRAASRRSPSVIPGRASHRPTTRRCSTRSTAAAVKVAPAWDSRSARELASALGGRLTVTSEPGRGRPSPSRCLASAAGYCDSTPSAPAAALNVSRSSSEKSTNRTHSIAGARPPAAQAAAMATGAARPLESRRRPSRSRCSDRPATERAGHLDGAAIRRCEQLGLSALAIAPHRPDGVDDIPGRQVARGGGNSVAGLAPADATALRHDRRPTGAMNRAIDAAAAGQPGVRGIHDRIDRLGGDVALDEFQPHGQRCIRQGRSTHATPVSAGTRPTPGVLHRAIGSGSGRPWPPPRRIPTHRRRRWIEQRGQRMIVEPGDTHILADAHTQLPAGGVDPVGNGIGQREYGGWRVGHRQGGDRAESRSRPPRSRFR